MPLIMLHACMLMQCKIETQKKNQPKRDKVSSQGPVGTPEPKALIPSCHAPDSENPVSEGIRQANPICY